MKAPRLGCFVLNAYWVIAENACPVRPDVWLISASGEYRMRWWDSRYLDELIASAVLTACDRGAKPLLIAKSDHYDGALGAGFGGLLPNVAGQAEQLVFDYDQLVRTKSAGVCPIQRRKALVKAL